jgi:hypothetical protein
MGRTTVEAVVPWEKRMAVGRRYLVFGIVHEGQIVAASAGIYEEVDRNTLRRLMQRQDPSERDEIETLNLDQVMILVEARKANAEAGKGK